MLGFAIPTRRRLDRSIVLNRRGMYGLVGFSVERLEEFELQLQEALKESPPATFLRSPQVEDI